MNEKNQKLSPEVHEQIVELLKKGLSVRAIAQQLDISPGSVQRQRSKIHSVLNQASIQFPDIQTSSDRLRQRLIQEWLQEPENQHRLLQIIKAEL
jgi:DNA-binding NarL/FixJ family response regulator